MADSSRLADQETGFVLPLSKASFFIIDHRGGGVESHSEPICRDTPYAWHHQSELTLPTPATSPTRPLRRLSP